MSKQYNKSVFVGHLGGEPEMRYTPAGTAVTTFNVATNDQYNNEKGETIKVTTWFRCTAWGKLGEVCNQYLKKGSKVLVEGRLTPDKATGRPRIWVRQDGTAAADYELKVLEIHFLDSRNNEPSIAQADPAEDDMDQQLMDMSIREVDLKKQLNAIQDAVDAQLLVDWEAKVQQYLADLKEGIHALHRMPEDPAEQRRVVELKRQIIETLVEKVSVDRDHQFTVTIRLHLLGILENTTGNGGSSNNGGQWPTGGTGNRSNPSGRTTGFKSRIGHIRVSANWIMQGM